MNTGNLIQLMFGFTGRVNRAKYWLVAAIYVAASLLIMALVILTSMPSAVMYVAATVIYIPLVISSIAVGIKRLHDRDKSGWWLLLFYVAPVLLSWLGVTIGLDTIFQIAGGAVWIWMIVELGFLRGTAGPNQYGPDPLAS